MTVQPEGSTPALAERALPVPVAGAGEVLIRVHAAGVTPTELNWFPTTHTAEGGVRVGAVPGHEFSGIIAALGAGVRGWEIGQAVYGCNDWFAPGATAEYCVASPATIALKPQRLTHAEAASVPIGALTAWQGLLDRAHLQTGERVLIHGGAGAVGLFAIQLAKRAGALVFTTASARHAEYLRGLGAERVIDYRAERFEEIAREIDVVFDGVGGDTLQRSRVVLKPEGRLVTIAANSKEAEDPRGQSAFLLVEAKQAQLIEIASLLDAGELQPCLDGAVPLEQAEAAYTSRLARAHARGKVVVSLLA